ALRIACLALGGILAIQLALFVVHAFFSRGLTIPALPSLPAGMEASVSQTNSAAATNTVKSGTNSVSTNVAAVKGMTNVISTNAGGAHPTKTNMLSSAAAAIADSSKAPVSHTNQPLSKNETNLVVATNGPGNTTNAATNDKNATNSSAKAMAKKGP